jgi:hypothetical protein
LTGTLCLENTYYVGEITYPSGYTTTLTISIITLNVNLSSDSTSLTITSPLGRSCDIQAVRDVSIVETTSITTTSVMVTSGTTVHSNAVAEQYINILMLFSLAFLSVVISF